MTNFLGLAEKLYETSRPWHVSVINIESGFVQVANRLFGDCECTRGGGLVSSCSECGRAVGNNLRFLAGKGDGLYVCFEFRDMQESEPSAWVLILDENNKLATEVARRVDQANEGAEGILPNGLHDLFNEFTEPYWNLPSALLGVVAPDPALGLVLSDVMTGRNSPYAPTITEEIPVGLGTFSVFVACEPILDRPGVALAVYGGMSEEAFTGGFTESQRPRAAVLMSSVIARDVLDHPSLSGHDWVQQAEAWRHTQVDGHVTDISGPACLLNGLINLRFADFLDDLPDSEEVSSAARLRYYRALTWFAKGSYLGDAACGDLLRDMVASFDVSFEDVENVLRDWLDHWGWDYTPQLARSLEQAVAGR